MIGLASASLIGVTSIDSPCPQDWAAWVATEGTSSNEEPSAASPTGYGWTLDDPLRGEVEDAAELDIGIDAAWASKARSLGSSGASGLLGTLSLKQLAEISFFPLGDDSEQVLGSVLGDPYVRALL